MKEFLKTFGKGILYFILIPVFALILLAYGIFLFFYNFKSIADALKEKKNSEIKSKEERAMAILQNNKYGKDIDLALSEALAAQKPVTNSTTNIVITNKEDLAEMINALNSQNAIQNQNISNNQAIEHNEHELIENASTNGYVEEINDDVVHGELLKRK